MNFKNIVVDIDDGICLLTLNRPEKRNALDHATWEEILTVVRACRSDTAVRVLIITGAGGKAFASGADIRQLLERKVLDALETIGQGVLNEMENLNKPVIAAIDGFALGGGCEVALACDIRIATQRSKLGLPEVNLGLVPGAGGTQRLQRLVGMGKAKELIFTGDIIDATEAKNIGLINQVVDDPEDLLPRAKEIAAKICTKGPVALAMAKAAINVGANTDIHSGLLFEKLAHTVAFSTEDRIEGTTAFLEKRKPEFTGA